MNKFLLLILSLVFIGTVFGQNKVGTTAAPFLGIGAGPTAIGMGGAFTAVASDPSALYWNPSGISRTGKTGVMIEHTNYLIGTSYNYFGGVVALDDENAIGLSVIDLDYGSDKVTTIEMPDGTGEQWSAMDLAIGLSYSRNLTDRFSIGGTVKMIRQTIWKESATGWALDAGLLYITPFNDLKIGMEMANFGTDMQMTGQDLYVTHNPDKSVAGDNPNIPAEYYTSSYPLPLLFRIGLSMDVLNTEDNTITLAVDALHPNDNAQSVNVGAQYVWNKMVYVRAGYKSLGIPNSQEGLTFGFGLGYELTYNLVLKVDYAYESYGLLKNIQKFALSINF
ncbi:MAG TPA: PorV/PorQ family protein [Ignavibacteriaceae bacterium]|nr:PorV/PorQ family protein [Ignavibacteriaceae bacterium]